MPSRINTTSNTRKDTAMTIWPLNKKIMGSTAVALLICGAYLLFSSDVSVDSYHAIQLSHALPDGSQVVLNSDSRLTYDDDFIQERRLNLDGEAFFEVEKGESFTVSTHEGEVTVLGTSFNVLAREGLLVVSCRTGKVSVSSESQSKTITQGERIRFRNGIPQRIEQINPLKIDSWTSGESYFEKVPLREVIAALSHKYDRSIDLPNVHQDRLYTGSFMHSDIEKALKTVLDPMGIKYTLDENEAVKID